MKIFFIIFCIIFLWIYLVYNLNKRYMKLGTLLFITLSYLTLYFGSNEEFFRLMVFQLYVCCIGFQDYETYYVSKQWVLFSVILIVCFLDSIYISGISFSIVACLMYLCKKNWIGCADIGILFVFGLILGFKRMFVCLLIAIGIGLLFCILSKKKIIPFITFLCIGAYIAILKGFSIWYMIYGILRV